MVVFGWPLSQILSGAGLCTMFNVLDIRDQALNFVPHPPTMETLSGKHAMHAGRQPGAGYKS